jgi:HSP20 family protein
MKSYACYPKTRAVYARPFAGFANPYFPHYTNGVSKQFSTADRPSANIVREENAYKIELAVPGLSKEQIKIELNDDQLIITGPNAEEETAQKFIRKEFDYAGFKRTFKLHKNADVSSMTATFEQGILTITVPDRTPVSTKINIQ